MVVTSLRKAYLENPRIRVEIDEKGACYRYALLLRQIKIPPASIRGKLEVVLKTRILQLQCLHYSNEIPFLLDDRWINLETVPEAKQESFVTIEPNGRLFEKVPWSTFVAEHIFSATNTDEQR
ncbi:MAG: UTRA domain-containing protein [SAR324 cluster bacterium]|nr:UTRA domain-containing protein [SAR324 cluster bacterium]